MRRPANRGGGGTVAAGAVRGSGSRHAAAGGPVGQRSGRRRAQIRQEMEERILAAAARVFSEAGFDGATTAAIAERARLPKANVHYYFRTKKRLYREVLGNILGRWMELMDVFTVDADPAEALATYIRAKVRLSREHPVESRVFANEIIHGAPNLRPFLRGRLRARVDEIARVFDAWAAGGRVDPIDARHLLFVLWAATQTYADFEVQVRSVLGSARMTAGDYDAAAEQLTALVLKGCGLASATRPGRRLSA